MCDVNTRANAFLDNVVEYLEEARQVYGTAFMSLEIAENALKRLLSMLFEEADDRYCPMKTYTEHMGMNFTRIHLIKDRAQRDQAFRNAFTDINFIRKGFK